MELTSLLKHAASTLISALVAPVHVKLILPVLPIVRGMVTAVSDLLQVRVTSTSW